MSGSTPAARSAATTRSVAPARSCSSGGGRDRLRDVLAAEREVAGGEVAALLDLQRRLVAAAERLRLRAARVEAAARRAARSATGTSPRQHLARLQLRELRVGDRDGAEQRAGVRVARVAEELVGGRRARRSCRGT